ncbi:MAG: hypothetical protein IRY83_04000 [Chloroflexi bacterium]|nr:hypothetical protein [Chloroflexota bacterium]
MEWISFLLGFLTAFLVSGMGITVLAWRAFAAVDAAHTEDVRAPRVLREAEEVVRCAEGRHND